MFNEIKDGWMYMPEHQKCRNRKLIFIAESPKVVTSPECRISANLFFGA